MYTVPFEIMIYLEWWLKKLNLHWFDRHLWLVKTGCNLHISCHFFAIFLLSFSSAWTCVFQKVCWKTLLQQPLFMSLANTRCCPNIGLTLARGLRRQPINNRSVPGVYWIRTVDNDPASLFIFGLCPNTCILSFVRFFELIILRRFSQTLFLLEFLSN